MGGGEWEPTEWDVRWLAGTLAEARSRLTDHRLQDLQTTMELERENSHFYLSEMLISAVEQMKWRQVLASSPLLLPAQHRHHSPRPCSEADEAYPASEVSLSRTGSPAPSSQPTFSPLYRQQTRYSSSSTTGDVSSSAAPTTPTLDTASTAGPPSTSGTSFPLPLERDERENSAEFVAQQLLANIAQLSSARRRAGQFLVSFSGAPQELLPMPSETEFAHSKDDAAVAAAVGNPRLQDEWFQGGGGNGDAGRWSRTKPPIISTPHPPPRVKKDTERQGNRCAGCGRGFYLKRVRYCDYLGKWFCLVCHVGASAQIPARVLHSWDFRSYPVCDSTLSFLGNSFSQPLFDLAALAPELYGRVKALRLIKAKRRHLRIMWDYVRTCRIAKEVVTKDGLILDMFLSLPSHFLESEDAYSMKDLNLVRDGTLEKLLDGPLCYARTHILGCQFCRAKGFHCLLCADRPRPKRRPGDEPELLFPFQSDKVSRCRDCGSCYHSVCWKSARRRGQPDCVFCERRRRRRLSYVQEAEVSDQLLNPAQTDQGAQLDQGAVEVAVDYGAPVRLWD